MEDIAQPKCFRVLDALRAEMNIPVWHDDQQGTAMVVLAGLTNALRVVGKELGSVRIALIGVGAANVATYRLLKVSGITPVAVVACDRRGVLHAEREDLGWKYEVDGREFLTAECAFQVGCLFWVDMLVLLPLGIWFASSMIAWS